MFQTDKMVSPRLNDLASQVGTRSEQEVRARRIKLAGRFYLILCNSKSGPYIAECTNIPFGTDWSEKRGLEELQQHDDPILVYECFPGEGHIRDVSEDMARLWLTEVWAFDEVPKFVSDHLGESEIDEHFTGVMA